MRVRTRHMKNEAIRKTTEGGDAENDNSPNVCISFWSANSIFLCTNCSHLANILISTHVVPNVVGANS